MTNHSGIISKNTLRYTNSAKNVKSCAVHIHFRYLSAPTIPLLTRLLWKQFTVEHNSIGSYLQAHHTWNITVKTNDTKSNEMLFKKKNEKLAVLLTFVFFSHFSIVLQFGYWRCIVTSLLWHCPPVVSDYTRKVR